MSYRNKFYISEKKIQLWLKLYVLFHSSVFIMLFSENVNKIREKLRLTAADRIICLHIQLSQVQLIILSKKNLVRLTRQQNRYPIFPGQVHLIYFTEIVQFIAYLVTVIDKLQLVTDDSCWQYELILYIIPIWFGY